MSGPTYYRITVPRTNGPACWEDEELIPASELGSITDPLLIIGPVNRRSVEELKTAFEAVNEVQS